LVSWAEHVASGKRTEVNGLEIFYIDRGSGDVVVLIHGWAPSSFIWRKIVPHLSQRFRVIAPDLPGYGLSQRLPGGLELEHLRKVMLGLLDRIGVREFNVVGHSMGGVISAYIAAMTPERVRKLVLINPGFFVGKGGLRPLAMKLARRLIGDPLARFMVRKSVVRSVLENVYVRKEALDDETVDGYYESIRYSGKTLIEASRIIEEFDQGLLKRLRCPVLFVLGRHDVLVSFERNLELAREIGAEVFLDETSGHNVHEENPEEVSRVIAEFLGR